MSLEFYLAYVFACFVVVIVPGPTVTLIVANSMTYGARAGLINIAGTQLGLAAMMVIVLVGLTSLIETMGSGSTGCGSPAPPISSGSAIKLIRSPGAIGDPAQTRSRASDFSGRAFSC